MAKKSGLMKDALILFAITLISGVALGGVYEVTKEPIIQATIASNNRTYREVFADASTFDEDASLAGKIADCNEKLKSQDFGSVGVQTVLNAKDESGKKIGYVVNSYSKDSYNGLIEISVGLKEDGTITAIGFRLTTDTPGLGLKAKDPSFKDQYIGKKAPSLSVVKTGNADDTQINAISGATITSRATTNAVNAALYFLHNCLN